MRRATRRLRFFWISLLGTAGVILGACFTINCLIDPLWYLRGNVLTGINYPFNERVSKIVRLLPRLREYDCLILGTSRATLLPEDMIAGHRCFNLAISDGQVGEYLFYADYLRSRGYAPARLIVDVRRADLLGPPQAIDVPDFIRTNEAPPSMLGTYLSADALMFSIRTLRRDGPHHRFYDEDFHARLEVRSKRRYYNPRIPIEPAEPPFDVRPERADLYVQLRRKFPTAHAIAYLPLESAWRTAAFSLTGQLNAYLAALDRIAAAYDRFLDFTLPSPLTESKDPKITYDGSHYSREANTRVAAALTADAPEIGFDWHGQDPAEIARLYQRRLAEFIVAANRGDGKGKKPAEAPSE